MKYRLYSERERPIPDDIANYIISKRSVSVRNIPYHYASSVSAIDISRDEYGYPETIFGMGDFRRNGGVKAL